MISVQEKEKIIKESKFIHARVIDMCAKRFRNNFKKALSLIDSKHTHIRYPTELIYHFLMSCHFITISFTRQTKSTTLVS